MYIRDWLTVLLYDDHCDKWWPTMHCIGMHCNEEKKKPVQISPEQLVGLVFVYLCLSICLCLCPSICLWCQMMTNDDKWWQMMTENEEKKKPVQISPEQLVGLVGEGHFAIRDNCRKHCQNINIWEWNEILSKNHMWYMYHPYFNLERCDSQPPAWWEQPTIAATSWQHLNVNTICASELLTLFVHQNVNTICASEC